MWNTQSIPSMMLGRTTTQNSDGGPWQLLTEQILPIWEAGDFGFEVVTKPRMEAVTHKFYFETTNKFGTLSRCYLESLAVEAEVEKFKGKNYSMIYIPELSHYKHRKTFDILQECLRPAVGAPNQFHRMICDTNPADEGEDSWIWKLWFWFRTLDLDNLDKETKVELNLHELDEEKYAKTIKALKRTQDNLAVHSYSIDDNIFITQEQKDEQFAKYAHSKDLLDRYYYGKWVKASGDGVFREVYRPGIHTIGESPERTVGEPEYMLPEEECIELGGGFDISSRRNTAFALIEPVSVAIEERDQKTGEKQTVLQPGFKILDEYVNLGRQQSIGDVSDEVLEKVEFWNLLCKRPPRWEHWSDNSSFDISGQTETSEAQDIYRLTGGVVELRSITGLKQMNVKGHGGVERRIDLIQRLLFEGRIWVNANKCPSICEMFASMKRNAKGKLSTTNIYKHAFDAISYYIAVKCWMEMKKQPRIVTNLDSQQAGIIVTRL